MNFPLPLTPPARGGRIIRNFVIDFSFRHAGKFLVAGKIRAKIQRRGRFDSREFLQAEYASKK